MNLQGLNNLREKHPILVNLVLIIALFFVLGYIAFLFLDIFTFHGEQKQVPNVKNLSLEQAEQKLTEAGFKWEISDSTYNDQYGPGIVVDQSPEEYSFVKAIRTIYLTVNAFNPRSVELPEKLTSNSMSVLEGRAWLRSNGFKDFEIDTIPSDAKGLILQVFINGKQAQPKMKVPVTAHVKLVVGDGSMDVMQDSTIIEPYMRDSLIYEEQEEKANHIE